jgi:hypothetical protein
MGTVVKGPWKGRSELSVEEPTFEQWRAVFVAQCAAEVEKNQSFLGSSLFERLFAATNESCR